MCDPGGGDSKVGTAGQRLGSDGPGMFGGMEPWIGGPVKGSWEWPQCQVRVRPSGASNARLRSQTVSWSLVVGCCGHCSARSRLDRV